MTEAEFITIFISLADQTLRYQNSFESYREQLYKQLSQGKSDINWDY